MLAGLAAAATPTYAFTTVQGTVGTVETVGSGAGAPGNLDFRVQLSGNPVICNGQIFAYVNLSDANYNAMVANILGAKAAGWGVTLNVAQDATGYCQLVWLWAN
jgi:hypothetical protein